MRHQQKARNGFVFSTRSLTKIMYLVCTNDTIPSRNSSTSGFSFWCNPDVGVKIIGYCGEKKRSPSLFPHNTRTVKSDTNWYCVFLLIVFLPIVVLHHKTDTSTTMKRSIEYNNIGAACQEAGHRQEAWVRKRETARRGIFHIVFATRVNVCRISTGYGIGTSSISFYFVDIRSLTHFFSVTQTHTHTHTHTIPRLGSLQGSSGTEASPRKKLGCWCVYIE